jgi:hypothetical protein
MLDVLCVTPALWIAVLQPDKRGSNIGWTMLDVVHDHWLFVPSRHEDFDSIIAIAVGALVERTLNAGDKRKPRELSEAELAGLHAWMEQ